MADENKLRELREKGRGDYGITNADDMDEKQLNDEIKAIDDQATQAEKDRQAEEKESQKSESES